MTLRRIATMALNDLRLTARDRSAFVWMLLMPLAMMWFFGGLGGDSDGPPRVALAVIDLDEGWLGEEVVRELERSLEEENGRVDLVRHTAASWDASADKVRSLVIPADFTRAVLAGRPRTLELRLEPGSSDSFGLAAQAHVARAVARTIGRLIELAHFHTTGAARADAVTDETAFRALAARPRRVGLEVTTAGRGRAVPSGFGQSVPGNLTFVVLMMTVIYGAVFLTQEKRQGMLRRQAGLPIDRRTLLAGKLAGRLLLAVLQIGVLLLAGRYLFGVTWGRSPVGLVLVLGSYAVAVAGLATAVGAVARNAEQASSVGWIGSMVMAALGGCWWPSELMPAWLQSAAHAFPTAWAMDALHGLISFGAGVEAVWKPCLVLLGFGAVFVAVGARFLEVHESGI